MSGLARRLWRRSTRRLGHAGMAAAIAVLAAATLAALLPVIARRAHAATYALHVAQRLAAVRGPAAAAAPTQAQLLQEFVDGFPSVDRNAADIAEVFAAADAHHLALPKGEYKLDADPSGSIVSYSATFPVRGDYVTLKDFCADVLSTLPHASMDELRIARDNAGSPSLDAVVRFTFFYRNH